MKTEDEIHKAHDMLTTILLRDLPRVELSETSALYLSGMCDVLCWVLDHGHNESFKEILEEIEKNLERAGYQMLRKLQ